MQRERAFRGEGMAAWLVALLIAVAALAPVVSTAKSNLSTTNGAMGSYLTTKVTYPLTAP